MKGIFLWITLTVTYNENTILFPCALYSTSSSHCVPCPLQKTSLHKIITGRTTTSKLDDKPTMHSYNQGMQTVLVWTSHHGFSLLCQLWWCQCGSDGGDETLSLKILLASFSFNCNMLAPSFSSFQVYVHPSWIWKLWCQVVLFSNMTITFGCELLNFMIIVSFPFPIPATSRSFEFLWPIFKVQHYVDLLIITPTWGWQSGRVGQFGLGQFLPDPITTLLEPTRSIIRSRTPTHT